MKKAYLKDEAFDLVIDGEKHGNLDLPSCWLVIDEAYSRLEDQYAGVVCWQLMGSKGRTSELVALHEMPASLWFAYAENAEAFAGWLDLFGWIKPVPWYRWVKHSL